MSDEFSLFRKQCMVYQVPPASSAGGHKADDWTNCIWKGNVQIFLLDTAGAMGIRLTAMETGGLFAECRIPAGKEYHQLIQKTIDSSRCFVMRVQDGSGGTATLGLAFDERNDAFDFWVMLRQIGANWKDGGIVCA